MHPIPVAAAACLPSGADGRENLMKTERRHDLGTNELAHWTAGWIERIKPYSSLLVTALIVLLGTAVVGSIWNSASQSQQERAWSAFAMAMNTSDFELKKVQQIASSDEYSGTDMQEWAFAAWADRQLSLASRSYLSNREASKERLQRIVGTYEQLAESSGDQQIRNRARYGLAQVYELQNRLEEARSQYDLVQGDYEAIARSRADHLMAPGMEETYNWLATAELPRRAFPDGPGTPGSRPAFEADFPDASKGPLDLGPKSLEEIFGTGDTDDSEDRYSTEGSAEEKERFEDLFEDEPTDGEAEAPESESPAETDTSTEPADTESSATEDTVEP
jgi:hypothetical protein